MAKNDRGNDLALRPISMMARVTYYDPDRRPLLQEEMQVIAYDAMAFYQEAMGRRLILAERLNLGSPHDIGIQIVVTEWQSVPEQ